MESFLQRRIQRPQFCCGRNSHIGSSESRAVLQMGVFDFLRTFLQKNMHFRMARESWSSESCANLTRSQASRKPPLRTAAQ
jgi:hypothetical protein